MRTTRYSLTVLLVIAVLFLFPGAPIAQDAILEYEGPPLGRDCHTENCST